MVVVGTSFGCLTHVRALKAAGFDVVGLVGRDPAKTKERAERFGVPTPLTSLDDALALPDVDAFTIATPPHTHADIALRVVGAGKHVVCEKPFARDTAEARRMLDAAEDAGVVHLLGTEFRFDSAQALMARLVREGAIGEPRLATFLLHIPLLATPGSDVPEWWARAEDGGGWLGAQAAHVIDQVRVTIGEFAGVNGALVNLADHGWSAEDTYAVRFATTNGCEGFMQSTASDWGELLITTRIAGSKATVWSDFTGVHIADATGSTVVPIPDDLVTAAPEPPPSDLLTTSYDLLHSTGIDLGPYTKLFETFRDLIVGTSIDGRPTPATFADGVKAMEVMDAIRRSADQREWVSLAGA